MAWCRIITLTLPNWIQNVSWLQKGYLVQIDGKGILNFKYKVPQQSMFVEVQQFIINMNVFML